MTDGGKRVLIVEDQTLIAEDIAQSLKKLGYSPVGNVGSGREAVDAAIQERPDLILMDVRLRGELDGIQAATLIRRHLDLPIVYLTAYADEETIRRAMLTGPFGYLVKPFHERELRAAIEVALYKHTTDRLLSEERARREAAEEFKLFVDGVQDYAIFLIDVSGRVTSWNEGAARIQGYTAEAILGEHISLFYSPEDVAAGKPQAALAQAAQGGRAEDESWRIRQDGTRFWANVTISALRDDLGNVRGFGMVVRDMTTRKQAELEIERLFQEAQDAVRARDEFLAIASHELRTPLSALVLQISAVDRLLRENSDDGLNDKLLGKVDKAVTSTTRLTKLIDNLLDVSRIATGRLELQREDLDLADVVRDVAERYSDEAHHSTLSVHCASNVAGQWDRLRVDQVIANLLSNAFKYGCGRPIEVSLKAEGDFAELMVRDHGIGVSPEDIARIFHRFERAVSVRHYGGLGLGLFITRQIIEAHGGRISVTSEPGEGSTFMVYLPRRPVMAHSTPKEARL